MLKPKESCAARITIDGDTDVIHLISGDLSTFSALVARLNMTKTDTAAGDTLVVKVQQTRDGVSWDDRIVFETITGDMSASAAAPETREKTIYSHPDPISSDDESLEPSGSAGSATGLAAGEVRHGPFAGPYRVRVATPTQNPGRYPAWRVVFDFTDATTDDEDMEGTFELWGIY